jgi:hypothetical protein
MKATRPAIQTRRPAAFAAALITILLLPDPDHLFHEGHFFMSKITAADETQKPVRESTTPLARDPKIAVEEEYRIALQHGTAAALELFIARHPDDPLAEKARADLRRLLR